MNFNSEKFLKEGKYTLEKLKFKVSNPTAIQFFEPKAEHIELIEDILLNLFESYNKVELYDTLRFSLRELIQNAWNLNLKFLLFRKNNLDISDFKDYIKGIRLFKSLINNRSYDEISKDVYNFNYWIKFYAFLSEHGIKFEIINNTPILPIEEKNLRLRLKLASACANLIELYNEGKFDSDDDKIGLAFIIFLLKKANIDPDLFRIGNVGGSSRARIEIPLSHLYVPERKKFLKRENLYLF
ncbi:MAG: hypothetical protein ACP5QT_00800 [Brevinematia bacterium]